MSAIRVLIVDDDPLVRRALASYMAAADDMVVVGEAGDGRAGIVAVEQLAPEVVLMDLRMPHMDGLDE